MTAAVARRPVPLALVARGMSPEQLTSATTLLDVPELVKRTGLSVRFWRDEIARGALPSVKAGRRRVVTEAALLAWVAERTLPAASPTPNHRS